MKTAVVKTQQKIIIDTFPRARKKARIKKLMIRVTA